MGNFKVELHAVGDHLGERHVGDGETLQGNVQPGDVGHLDTIVHKFVEDLQAAGASVESAVLTHWPDSADSIEDDLLTKIRHSGDNPHVGKNTPDDGDHPDLPADYETTDAQDPVA